MMESDDQNDDLHDLRSINRKLKRGYSAKITDKERLYYLNHNNRTSSWLPPSESWDCGEQKLPYGWEAAHDKEGKPYYINHINKTTTYEDPHKDDSDEVPQPREVSLVRDPQKGFGFVAGSEKPVIVRFVTEGGPSSEKLLPGDQILKINGENVKKAPRDHVIELVRSCQEIVNLVVCQPYTENHSTRKSALLSASKKAKLKSNPSRVRFAEGVVINESPLYSPSDESCIPFMPNVLKVFLENGQTKSFKYDSVTTVQDVLQSLQEKISIKCIEHFSLMVEHIKSLRRNKLRLLNPRETLARIAARPGAQHLRCLFRLTFVPKDAYDLLRKDAVSFEYLYVQCCNDVVQEKFAPELKYDIALRLAALHIQQHSLSSNLQGKLSVKSVEKECGLERFVPTSLVETMKRKELRKLLSHFLKLNQNLSAPGQKHLTALQAKLHYLKIISELPSYGAKCFSTNLRDSNSETVILVSPKFGISQISGTRNGVPLVLAQMDELCSASVCHEDELSRLVEIRVKDANREPIIFSLEDKEAEELILLLQGYFRLLKNKEFPVDVEKEQWDTDSAPVYYGSHNVKQAPWSYSPLSLVEKKIEANNHQLRTIDLTITPPRYLPSDLPPELPETNGCLGSEESSSELSSLSSSSLTGGKMNGEMAVEINNHVDKNMNKMQQSLSSPRSKLDNENNVNTNEMETYDNVNRQRNSQKRFGNNDNSSSGTGIDISSVVSFEVLESAAKDDDGNDVDSNMIEAKNEEVIRRVSEMEAMVQDAESYLSTGVSPSGDDGSATKSTGSNESAEGVLKPADSLTLLTQELENEEMTLQQVIENMKPEIDPSESDTDSVSTPSDSPSRKNRNNETSDKSKRDSSFGLHSPDNLIPMCVDDDDDAKIQDLLKKIQLDGNATSTISNGDDIQLRLPFAEGSLYLDPDIIDLTMIPPPMTPDREQIVFAPTSSISSVNAPPTPFADRSTLEAELRAMTELTNGLSAEALSFGSQTGFRFADDDVEKITKQLIDDGNDSEIDASTTESDYSFIYNENMTSSELHSLQATLAKLQMENCTKYSNDYANTNLNSDELESFIASVTIPPPPSCNSSGNTSFESVASLIDEPTGVPPTPESFELLTHDDIKAYIIPPPPPNSSLMSSSDATNYSPKITDWHKDSLKDSVKDSEHHKKKSAAELLFPDGKLPVCKHTSIPSFLPPPRKKTIPLSYVRQKLNNDCEISGNESPMSFYDRFNSLPRIAKKLNSREKHLDDLSILYSRLHDENSSIYAGFDDAATIAESIPQRGSSIAFNDDSVFSASESDGSARSDNSLKKKSILSKNVESTVQKLQNSAVVVEGSRFEKDYHLSSGSESSGNSTPTSGIPRSSPSTVRHKYNSASSCRPVPPPKPRSVSADQTKSSTSSGQRQRSSSSNSFVGNGSTHNSPKSSHVNGTRPTISAKPTVVADTTNFQRNPHKPPLPPGTLQENGRNSLNKKFRSPSPARRGKSKSTPRRPSTNGIDSEPKNVGQKKPPTFPSQSDGRSQSKGKPDIGANKNCELSPKLGSSKLPRPMELTKPEFNGTSSRTSTFFGSNAPTANGSVIDCHNFEDDSPLESELEIPFHKAGEDIAAMILNLDEALGSSPTNREPPQEIDDVDMEKYVAAKDTLAMESRQFVTASKLFVKSVSESTEKMVEHLTLCVKLLERMFEVSEMIAHTTIIYKGQHVLTIVQMQDLVARVKEVAFTYMQTVQAASDVVNPNSSTNPTVVNLLMQQATSLANVLTSFMRNLKTYNNI